MTLGIGRITSSASRRVGTTRPPKTTARPRCSPIISTAFRSQIDAPAATVHRLRQAGMPTWTNEADARRPVCHLGKLMRDGQVHESHLSQLLRTYRSALTLPIC